VRAQVVDGDGGPSNAVTKLISVTPVNDAPRLLPLIGGTVAYVRGAAAVGLLPGAVVNDPDSPNFAGGKLVVRATAGFHASNRLLIAGGFTLVGNQVRLNGTTIGLRNTNGGIGFTKLEITFNGNATREIVEQLVRGIRFRTAGPSPTTQRVFELFVTDGDGGSSNKVSKIVNVS
jgi:hypothetical protein